MANTVSTKKVTDLPENTDVKEEDLFIAGANGTASLRKIKFSAILKKIRNTLIANNRTTTEEGYALDARQGKEIQEQIDQLNTNIIDGTHINAWSYMGKFHYDNKSCIFSFDYTAGTEVKIGTAIITDIPRPLYVTIIPCTIIKADTVTFKTSALTVNEGGISIGHDLSFKDRVIATGFYNAMQSTTVSD